MPKVTVKGKVKHFPYTKKGKKAAKKASGKSKLGKVAEKDFFNSKSS